MKNVLKLVTISIIIVMLVISFAGCGEKTKNDNEKKVLKMGTNAEFPPFEFVDGGNFKGIDVEFAKAIGDELGYEIQIENLEFDSLITALNSKNVDFIAAGMTVNPTREKEVNFSMKYYTAKQVLIIKEDSTIATLDDLVGKKIGVQAGTTGNFIAEEIEGAVDNKLINSLSTGSLAVTALINGQIDAVIIDNLPAKEFVAKNNGLKIVEGLFEDEQYAMAFRKSDTDLLSEFNTAMNKLINNGKFQEIVDKYMLEK